MRDNSKSNRKVLFFSFVGANYSRSGTILNYHSDLFQKEFFSLPTGVWRFSREILLKINQVRTAEFLVVMSPCHIVTPVLKLLTRKPVILDAGWSLTDGQLSRGATIRAWPKIVKSYLLDFISMHTADMIIVESNSQASRTARLFRLKMGKIRVNFTGLDETLFRNGSLDSQTTRMLRQKIKNLDRRITVLFRGKINNESGIENIIDAARILKDHATFILVCGGNDLIPIMHQNMIRLSDISYSEMSEIYHMSDITLGQISNHSRLRYTIPHKAFESGFFSKPYITANSLGIRELYEADSIIVLNDVSGESIAAEITKFIDQKNRLEKSALIHSQYKAKASQDVLGSRFEAILQELE